MRIEADVQMGACFRSTYVLYDVLVLKKGGDLLRTSTVGMGSSNTY